MTAKKPRTSAPTPQSLPALPISRSRYRPASGSFETKGGIVVSRTVEKVLATQAEEEFVKLAGELGAPRIGPPLGKRANDRGATDSQRGCLFQSQYDFPGRYSRWSLGFKNPPVVLECRGLGFQVTALNERGKVMLGWIEQRLRKVPAVGQLTSAPGSLIGVVTPSQGRFAEEERSKQNSSFSVVRAIKELFATETSVDPQLGLFGAFGYDLAFQFEPVKQKHVRSPNDGERDLVLYIPDEILVHDVPGGRAWRLQYDFEMPGAGATAGLARTGASVAFESARTTVQQRDNPRGTYARAVERAKEEFKCGNLFECVLSQTFREVCASPPSVVYARLYTNNPSPFLFLLNLGRSEYLVGASPEMFVRVEETSKGLRVETCPISGTIPRGADALQDADRVLEILANRKEKSELTMCTDVDRNDKSRVCVPGSVQVVGRRQIESYSKLIHTVDHVEGYLRPGFDALDALLVHTWAVTVSGAPKTWAIQFVEDQEVSPRRWYGGAVGIVGFDGHLNTGLTIRTVRIKDGVAEVRAGATLLFDSTPDDEEKETELKASALLEAINNTYAPKLAAHGDAASATTTMGAGLNVLLIDHEDSFVHTLANYLRQTGATVSTVRASSFVPGDLDGVHLAILSPGPGRPADFNCSRTLQTIKDRGVACFGVCLGLQAMVEFFGGELAVLDYPMHGKPSAVTVVEAAPGMFRGLPTTFTVARYHSLYGVVLPDCLQVTAVAAARGEEGGADICMAVRHESLPFSAVQFHPESILTDREHGLRILANALPPKA